MTITRTGTAKLQQLRTEAEDHGDTATVALVDAAIAGDTEAARKLGVSARAVKAASTGASARAPRTRRPASGITTSAHPWAHDEE